MPSNSPTVWTIGHSTRGIEEFVSVLAAYDIETLIDVRRFPESRRQPQFGHAALDRSLAGPGIAYRWLPALGGRRSPQPDSVNLGWRNTAFRGYADHVASEEFAEGLFELLTLANGMRTAVMCAELLWWRCHRRIIADVLLSIGIPVVHIWDADKSELHRLTAPARVARGRLVYTDTSGST
ncbi:MAG TPA: DUF488 domain-containing protein [Gemmatimonadaceae bacterium]|nr:DUF488 domain-containing protein [Gemmatimonadaceae bacterium]